MTGWHTRPLCGWDVESTGVNVETDRIVTAAIVNVGGPNGKRSDSWLINPGVEIPEGAAAVHGVTTEHAREHGDEPARVLDVVTADLALTLRRGIPVVIMNAPYDLTILDRECRRHGLPTLGERLAPDPVGPIIDPRVLDKKVDQYRRGGRKLTDLCEHYGVKLDGAHEATADAVGALRVAWQIAKLHPEVGTMPLPKLHEWQVEWAAQQMASFAEYRRKKGEPLDDEDGSWPIRPYETSTTQQEKEAA